jgi:hypothetical protein
MRFARLSLTAPANLDPYRARLYRALLLLAALYNLAFGAWASLWPASFFDVFDLAPPLYPAIWRCLGMVVGIYGLAYAYAALRLDRAIPLVALGLLGKVLGPLGWLFTVASGEWPLRTFSLIVFNDLIWWLPFALFLIEGTRLAPRLRALAPYLCALLNGLAGLALLLVLRPGTEAGGSLGARAAYITAHPVAWRLGWLLWMLAALSLLGLYAWWGARLARPAVGLFALGLATLGLVCDFLGESLLIAWIPEHFTALHRPASLLTGGLANGLYTLAGITLTLATRWLARPLRLWAWAAWLAGLSLSVATFLNDAPAQVFAGAALMLFFVPFCAAFGWYTTRHAAPFSLREKGQG